MDPYALIAQYPNAGEAFATAFKQGMADNEKRAYQNALAKLATGANDPQALAMVYRFNPEAGAAMEQQLRKRADNTRADKLRGAESQMLLAGAPQNALAPWAPPTSVMSDGAAPPMTAGAPPSQQQAPQAPAQSELSPEQHGAWRSYAASVAKWADTPEKWDQAIDYLLQSQHPDISTPDLVALKGKFSPELRQSFMAMGGNADPSQSPSGQGQPDAYSQAQRDAINADPEGYLTFQGKQLDLTKGQLKIATDVNAQAMQILGGVHDDASLQAAKDQARQLYHAYGLDPAPIDAIPDTYDPQVVHDLQMRGMDTAKQLEAVARENRVNIYADNTAADNARADRSEQSLEDYRAGRLKQMGAPKPQRQPAPRSPTPNTVIGRIMDKQAAGQQLTPAEQKTLTDYRSSQHPTRGSRAGGPSSDLVGPVYQRGKVRIQYSTSAGKYVPVK